MYKGKIFLRGGYLQEKSSESAFIWGQIVASRGRGSCTGSHRKHVLLGKDRYQSAWEGALVTVPAASAR